MGTALEEGTEVHLGPLPLTPRATNLNEGNLLKEIRDQLESILRLLKVVVIHTKHSVCLGDGAGLLVAMAPRALGYTHQGWLESGVRL